VACLHCAAPVERIELNVGSAETVRAIREGKLPWTLHTACEYASDPGQWGASLVNDAELILACLDARAPRSIAEIGAYAGDVTRLLLGWDARSWTRIWAIDPSPQEELVRLASERPEVELIRATSLDALRRIPRPEAVIVDGDHNYHTVSEELRLIVEKAEGARPPLLLFHDVGWPHARRDDYFAPEEIPEEYRQPTAEGGGLFPGISGTRRGGLPYRWPAGREGGPRNGVLTAVEDFIAEHDEFRLAVVPAFFGLGVVWHREAPWAAAVADVIARWDRNPLVERLEANRVFHLASMHYQMAAATAALQRAARQEALLRRLLQSSAFAVAERLSRLRQRVGIAPAAPPVSKDELRRILGD
jgi:Methyltransferase domain